MIAFTPKKMLLPEQKFITNQDRKRCLDGDLTITLFEGRTHITVKATVNWDVDLNSSERNPTFLPTCDSGWTFSRLCDQHKSQEIQSFSFRPGAVFKEL